MSEGYHLGSPRDAFGEIVAQTTDTSVTSTIRGRRSVCRPADVRLPGKMVWRFEADGKTRVKVHVELEICAYSSPSLSTRSANGAQPSVAAAR